MKGHYIFPNLLTYKVYIYVSLILLDWNKIGAEGALHISKLINLQSLNLGKLNFIRI